jgi:hypothetical protein
MSVGMSLHEAQAAGPQAGRLVYVVGLVQSPLAGSRAN